MGPGLTWKLKQIGKSSQNCPILVNACTDILGVFCHVYCVCVYIIKGSTVVPLL